MQTTLTEDLLLPEDISKAATEAYRQYRVRCFWSYREDFVIKTVSDLRFLGTGLKTFGGRDGFMLAASLCHLAHIK